ncbi:MAG: NAD-dependent protein deacylase [Myxococcales bacterium]
MVAIPRVGPGEGFPPLSVGPQTRVFVLTGAGISAESGLRTFRDGNGLWEEHRVEDVATPEGFDRDANLVWRFYSERRRQAGACQPNAATLHESDLGEAIGERLFLCTQNVDPLHERAGSRAVVHMHGALAATRCESCARPPFADESLHLSAVPRCDCGARLRPDIVWFGEVPFHLERIFAALSACDVFVTVGSSGAVHPAAGFVSHLRNVPSSRTGRFAKTVYVGLEKPENAYAFDEVRLGKAGEIVPGLFAPG